MDTTTRRPGDTFRPPQAWQVAGGPGDGRWGVAYDRYEYMNGQCRYCGSHYQGPEHSVTAHPRVRCLACGTPQCDRSSGKCLACLAGWLRTSFWGARGSKSQCGYKDCESQAVADAPRVGQVCLAHLNKPKLRGQTLADQIANSVRLRDLGGQSWQKLTWFGPELRYAVRRWRGAEPQAWTTGEDPEGFATAGQADREADAWKGNDWHAERVTITDEVREQIRARYPEHPVTELDARTREELLGDPYAEYGFDHAWERD